MKGPILIQNLLLCGNLAFSAQPGLFHVEQSSTVSFELANRLAAQAIPLRGEFQSLDARIQSTDLELSSIRVWPEPRVAVGPVFYDSDRIAPGTFGDVGYQFSQGFPKPNERAIISSAAKLVAQSARLERDAGEANLRRDVYQSLIRSAELSESLALRQDDLRWIQTIVSRKEARFKVQQGGHNELMALQNERGMHELELELITNRLETAHFRLNRLLNQPETNTFPFLKLPIPLNPIRYQSNLVETAINRNPDLKRLELNIQLAEAKEDAVELDLLPRWSVQAEARQYSGDGGFREGSIRLGLSIPWGNRSQLKAAVAARSKLVESARFQLSEAKAQLREQLHALTMEMDGFNRMLRMHRDEIQLRRQEIAASAQSAWEVNRGSLDNLLNHRRQLMADRLKVVQLTARLHHVAADILRLAGASSIADLSVQSE